jgi:hypothetical protein
MFSQALAVDPNNALANVVFASTRVVERALSDQQLLALANRSGVTITGDSHNVCSLRATLQTVPVSAPRTGEILTALRDVLLPEIEAGLSNLSRFSASDSITVNPLDLPSCLRLPARSPLVEIDRGDTAALAGILRVAHAVFDILTAYNVDVDLPTAVNQPPRDILAAAPTLLTLRSSSPLTTARGFTEQAFADFGASIAAVLAETDDQTKLSV